MKVGHLLRVIVGVISDFSVCALLSQAQWLNGVWCVSLCVALLSMPSEQILLSKPSAVPYAVHMEGIKVRHGANARNGALVLIRYVSVVTCRGHRILAKRPGNSVVPVDDQNLLFQKCLWDSLTVCGRIFNKLNFEAVPPHLLVMKAKSVWTEANEIVACSV